MNCWKCGEPTEHGAPECGVCESGFKFRALDDDEDEKLEWLEIDWSKITTFEELKFVLQEADICSIVLKGSETAKKLSRFLKPEEKE